MNTYSASADFLEAVYCSELALTGRPQLKRDGHGPLCYSGTLTSCPSIEVIKYANTAKPCEN